ncbi:hypothetical protein GCM10029964_119820 [Kibdelosporangium lantanae]
MSMGYEIGDYRFEGYSNEQLATLVEQVRQGPGSGMMQGAVEALTNIANGLKQTDSTLREQLKAIGVEWTGESSQTAQVTMTDSAQYGGEANGTITTSAGAVGNQGSDYSRARNSVPESSKLRGDQNYNVVDTLLLHTTDHSKEVQETQASRQQAIDSMNQYADASRTNLSNYQSLPVPPNLSLNSQPVEHRLNGTSVQGFTSEGQYVPGGPGGNANFPGGPPVTGGNPGIERELPGTGFQPPGGGVPGQNQQLPPGRTAGLGPMPAPFTEPPLPSPPPFRPSLAGLDTAIVGMAGGGAGGGAVGAGADKDRIVRGGRPGVGGAAGEGRVGGSRGRVPRSVGRRVRRPPRGPRTGWARRAGPGPP